MLLERADAITKDVLELITFVLAYPTLYGFNATSFGLRGHHPTNKRLDNYYIFCETLSFIIHVYIWDFHQYHKRVCLINCKELK
jgi:hypothetical protein